VKKWQKRIRDIPNSRDKSLKNLYYISTDIKVIKHKLFDLGHNARNLINAQHRNTKEPLNLFFVGLETSENKKEICKHKSVPRVKKKNIINCMRCQQYGYSESFCNKPFFSDKCDGIHNRQYCKKSEETSAKCALRRGNHLTNYKSCEYYHNLIKV